MAQTPMQDVHLQPGQGYWEVTYYPIGGCFRRSPRDTALLVTKIEVISPPYQGANRYGYLEDGNKIAFASSGTVEYREAQAKLWESV